MIDHMSIPVKDFQKSKAFYEKALAPLGYTLQAELGADVAGFGKDGGDFWIGKGEPAKVHIHVAFAAKSRQEVDAFYKAAIAAGGKDNGKPGLRPEYHEKYYGAFVLDLDGYNIEAVHHG